MNIEEINSRGPIPCPQRGPVGNPSNRAGRRRLRYCADNPLRSRRQRGKSPRRAPERGLILREGITVIEVKE